MEQHLKVQFSNINLIATNKREQRSKILVII